MYYSQEVLDSFGEEKVEEILLNNTNINIFSNNYQERKALNALENYLIKYYKNAKTNELRSAIENRINYLFELMEYKPYVLAYSKILSNSDITKIFIQGNSYRFFKYSRALEELKKNFGENYDTKRTGTNRLNIYAYLLTRVNANTDDHDVLVEASSILTNDDIPKDDIAKIFTFEFVKKYIMNKLGLDDATRIQLADLISGEDGVFRASIIGDDVIYLNPDEHQVKYKKLEDMIGVVCKATIRSINKKNKTEFNEDDLSIDCMNEIYENTNEYIDTPPSRN